MADQHQPQGYLALLLHAHLPYVRHPEHEDFLEEDWFFEGMSETYIPLLQVFERLSAEAVPFRITMSITPPLAEMMADDLLCRRYLRRLESLLELGEREAVEKRGTAFEKTALMYRDFFRSVRETFVDRCRMKILSAFRRFQDEGVLEIVTCPATHGFLPLMLTPNAVRAQVAVACANYRKHFGRDPRGIWLSECAYAPGVDVALAREGIRYFFLDAHGVLLGRPRPRYGVYAPVYTPNAVAAFGRDMESSKQVWSSEEGYPGDGAYREFYRDLGYDAPYDYVRKYMHPDGIRRNIGFKYHRITGRVPLHEKTPYDPDAARETAALHAGNFMFNRRHQARYLASLLGQPPFILAPYDAELFGHWWFEGPRFLDYLIRKLAFDQRDVVLVAPGEYLDDHRRLQVIEPSASTWGDKGYNEVWLNGANDWIYRHLHACEQRMVELAERFPNAQGIFRRALNQAAREILLAQSSDWAFILTTGTATSYAQKRTRDHVSRFHELYGQLLSGRVDDRRLADIEAQDAIFPEIDYGVYRS
ncbi:MAG: 1,4-alpha-glucan branching protein domain-containing protein [Planctomycetota bacterium]